CRLQRVRDRVQPPVRNPDTGKFRSSLPGTEHWGLLESLEHHSFILVSRPRLHAISLHRAKEKVVQERPGRVLPRLFSFVRIDGALARDRTALSDLRGLPCQPLYGA